jgi:hypothetical protein
MPNSLVFTCLSHDIIAHELTHAILDGIHRNYNEPTNCDVLAFHEAFADIVALFQHFTFPEVLRHQIAQTRGDLTSPNLLGELAQQFGTAIGSYGSLRSAIGKYDEATKTWHPQTPCSEDYRNVMEPHARGSILVAAVFEAFISIYKSRIADLLRIASGGSGILPQGNLHPDLVNRFATEASKAAAHVLTMCIRALDYCAPVDITFGDYLRAIITADMELVVDDTRDYRLAFIEAFRKRGIYPAGIKTLSEESLQQPLIDIKFVEGSNGLEVKKSNITDDNQDMSHLLGVIATFLRDYGNVIKYVNDREKIFNLTRDYISGRKETEKEKAILGLHQQIRMNFSYSKAFAGITGLAFTDGYENIGISRSGKEGYDGPSFQIQNLRMVNRVGPNGSQVNQVIFSIVQSSKVRYENGKFVHPKSSVKDDFFIYKGGCTMIFDLDTLMLKYAISKPLIDTEHLKTGAAPVVDFQRLKAQFDYITYRNDADENPFKMHFGSPVTEIVEPFSFLHQH